MELRIWYIPLGCKSIPPPPPGLSDSLCAIVVNEIFINPAFDIAPPDLATFLTKVLLMRVLIIAFSTTKGELIPFDIAPPDVVATFILKVQ